MHPIAFRCDQGKEFVNNDLHKWLTEQGVELQTTAPHSPSQNGAAERLNRTLVELARTMMIAQNVPIFLWEYAIKHAMYLQKLLSIKPPMKCGPATNWMSPTFVSLVAQSMIYFKGKTRGLNSYLNPNNKYLSAMTTDQNQFNIIIRKPGKSSPRETTNS